MTIVIHKSSAHMTIVLVVQPSTPQLARQTDRPARHRQDEGVSIEPDRHPADRRAATRQRILDAAAHLFRAHGIDGVGVDAVMQAAGLTHGGFYAHFASKESLAAEVARCQLGDAERRWQDLSRSGPPRAALAAIVRPYLDPERVAAGRCCILTTMGNDVARRAAGRGAVAAALDGMIDALRRCLPGRRRQKALVTLSTMVGAVVLARLADDPALAREVLDSAADALLGPPRAASDRATPSPATPSPATQG